jgi:hypothetical protein
MDGFGLIPQLVRFVLFRKENNYLWLLVTSQALRVVYGAVAIFLSCELHGELPWDYTFTQRGELLQELATARLRKQSVLGTPSLKQFQMNTLHFRVL